MAFRTSYKDVTLAQLRGFATVCRSGSYAAAARDLMLTSPAVWEQMQGLERHYGCKLLRRRGNGIGPTMEGEHLLEMVRPLIAGIETTREALHERGGALPPALTIATNLRVLVEEISEALAQFHRSYRGVRLRLIFTGNDVNERIASGDADLGLTLEAGPETPGAGLVEYRAAGQIDYLLVMPRRHPLAKAKALSLRRILRFPLVLGESAAYSRHRVQEVLHRYNLTESVHIALETSSDEYTLACVRAGIGLGITVGAGRGPLYSGLTVRSLRRWFGAARLRFVWRKGAHLLDCQQALAKAIREHLKGSQPHDGG
jgi:DNA-binding transcriptional LysR family regulator